MENPIKQLLEAKKELKEMRKSHADHQVIVELEEFIEELSQIIKRKQISKN